MISVIIPAYNYASYLPDALDSLTRQSFHDWECLIINNGSADNTQEIVEPYIEKDIRFRYYEIKNKGVSHARNFAIQKANGKFIQFLDADDMLDTEKLKVHSDYLIQHNNVDLIYGEARYFTTENKTLRNFSMHQKDVDWMPRISGKGSLLISALLKRNIFPINAPLFRKSLPEKFGAFNEDYSGLEDWYLWLQFALNGARFQWIDSPHATALIRIHSASASQNKKMMHAHILPLLQHSLYHSSTNLKQKFYLLTRYEEELYDLFLFALKGRIEKILPSQNNSVWSFLLLLLISIPFFPFYIMIKIYRRIFQ